LKFKKDRGRYALKLKKIKENCKKICQKAESNTTFIVFHPFSWDLSIDSSKKR
jgi:hypothetical protein